jgi:hypothetical protein
MVPFEFNCPMQSLTKTSKSDGGAPEVTMNVCLVRIRNSTDSVYEEYVPSADPGSGTSLIAAAPHSHKPRDR